MEGNLAPVMVVTKEKLTEDRLFGISLIWLYLYFPPTL